MNKKLLKSIICVASGVGVATSIPFAATSCGSSSKDDVIPPNALPYEVYEIDENNVLLGFKAGIDLSQYEGICDTMQIPARVREISDEAFYANDSSTILSFIKNLTFAEGSHCSSIGEGAFTESGLTSVDLSNCHNLSECYYGAFFECSSLTSVDFSNATNLSLIDDSVFGRCLALSSIDLSNCKNLSSIGLFAFSECASLTSVSFPKNLSVVESSAFNSCLNLSSITWDAWVGTIGVYNDSFSGVCPNGGTVTVTNPDGYDSVDLLQYLVNRAGLPESWLPAPELPDDVYIIENNVLKGFTSAFLANPSAYRLCNTMKIPANVTSIANSAFSSSKNIPSFITNLTFAENSNCSSIGIEAFNVFSSLISINFSNAIKLSTIDQYCFFGCSSLTSVSFPSSLKTIDFGCFGNCSALNNIIWNLPDDYQTSITIGQRAFDGISNSGTVTSLNQKITSQQLLSWIKQKGDFPASDDWRAAN